MTTERITIGKFFRNWLFFYAAIALVGLALVSIAFFFIGLGDIIFVGEIWRGSSRIVGSSIVMGLLVSVVYTVANDLIADEEAGKAG